MAENVATWGPRMQRALWRTSLTARRVLDTVGPIGVREARSGSPILSGRLRASIHHEVRGEVVGDMSLSIQSNHPGAGAQEEGGLIRSSGKAMTVPIGHKIQGGPRADSYPLFRLTARDGREYLATEVGGNLLLRWALLREIKLKGHHFLRAGQERVASFLGDRLLDAMEAEVLRGR